MDYQKALNILGLKPNFTEEELKKVHRELANKYHPDRNKSPEAESKMKDINEARDYLVRYFKIFQNHYTRNTSQSSTNEKNYREAKIYYQEKIKELSNIAKFDFNKYKVSNEIHEVIDAIKKIVHYYSVYTKDKKETVHQEYEEYLKMIKYRFKELTAKFYKENGIDKNDVKETINYDCTLEELYEQLLKISDKYGKESIIKKILETETEKYKTYAGYDEISDRIESFTNDILSKIKNNGFNYTKKDINDMHIEIERIFKTYYTLLKKISELENIVNTIENQEIINYYELIERNFYSGIPYSEFDEHIKELEKMIDKYQKENQRKINFKNNEQEINKIYQLLITRYSEVLKDYNIVTDHKIINDYNNLLNQLFKLFVKGCDELKDLEYFEQFNQFTFKDVVVENTIIENILQNSKKESNNCKIYIKRKDKAKRLFDATSFFYFDKDKMQIYLLGSQTIIKENINQQELDKDYISLDELLDISEYVGKWMVNANNYYRIYIYYYADGYIIYQNPSNERIHILVNPPKYFKTDYDNTKIISDEMKNKKTMQDLIEKQLKQRIDEYEQEKCRNDRRYTFDPNSKEYKNIFGESVFQKYSDFDSYKADNHFNKKR